MKYQALINELVEERYLKTPRIIKAFKKIHRSKFLPEGQKEYAHANIPLPIHKGQTISQPLTVAFMTELLDPKPGDKILEIGAGSGWQAAILSEIVGKDGFVYTTEIISELVEFAKENLDKSKIKNVKVILTDGSKGLKQFAPFDKIIVTAAAPRIPNPLKEQLKVKGRLVIPIGEYIQRMILVKKISKNKYQEEDYGSFRFVPLKGEYGW